MFNLRITHARDNLIKINLVINLIEKESYLRLKIETLLKSLKLATIYNDFSQSKKPISCPRKKTIVNRGKERKKTYPRKLNKQKKEC